MFVMPYYVNQLAHIVKGVAYLMTVPTERQSLVAFREHTLYRLLLRARRVENDEMIRRLVELGHDVLPSWPGLLANLVPDGTSISTLAVRAGVTRQAASQALKEIETRGYVHREDDPDDARSIIIKRTARGERLLRDALKIVTSLEASYARSVGKARFEAMRETLFDLLEEIDPVGRLRS